MGIILRRSITTDRWVNTSFLRGDGKEEYRERPQFGNRHAIFEKGALIGQVHVDEHNALDFPNGSLNHGAKYVNERTGMSEDIAKGLIVVGAAYGLHKLLKFLTRNI